MEGQDGSRKLRGEKAVQFIFGILDGVLAQLVERLVRNEKVGSSSLPGSTIFNGFLDVLKVFYPLAFIRVDESQSVKRNHGD